ncbi:MAG: ABC transporter ATP-binding protein [Candidatus Palauibacterales bacterium]|nr:ABC transporter ATP-binding protein [Candidatus Palauibacterales bacterium]MDP2530965.1 ABC transporter ATP-binding protein [Candidatus Palauibacterales bacterium]MDP2583408.1 ABC transporter ATP-binding protein [Candidatus Palauibacterales bacterium]
MDAASRRDMPLLEVEELSTWFRTRSGDAHAVDGVSFQLRAGETLGLVGESGSGKSVTALSLLGLVPRPAGRIVTGSSVRLRGEELVGADERRLRAVRGGEIAMVFQEPMTSLNPVLTIGRQVEEGIRIHRRLPANEARSEAVRMLERVGIPEPADRIRAYPHQLSGGMRQRVMIAMALACRPSILVADEPTTALDVTVQAQILELLLDLQRELGMAILLITHDLGVVAEVADRVAVMYAGRIVETATVEDLFEAPAHPYTAGLMAAVPDPDRPAQRLTAIPGNVPEPTRWPDGCRFHPRCPHAWERCRGAEPGLLETAAGGRSRCWLIEEPDRRLPTAFSSGTGGEP